MTPSATATRGVPRGATMSMPLWGPSWGRGAPKSSVKLCTPSTGKTIRCRALRASRLRSRERSAAPLTGEALAALVSGDRQVGAGPEGAIDGEPVAAAAQGRLQAAHASPSAPTARVPGAVGTRARRGSPAGPEAPVGHTGGQESRRHGPAHGGAGARAVPPSTATGSPAFTRARCSVHLGTVGPEAQHAVATPPRAWWGRAGGRPTGPATRAADGRPGRSRAGPGAAGTRPRPGGCRPQTRRPPPGSRGSGARAAAARAPWGRAHPGRARRPPTWAAAAGARRPRRPSGRPGRRPARGRRSAPRTGDGAPWQVSGLFAGALPAPSPLTPRLQALPSTMVVRQRNPASSCGSTSNGSRSSTVTSPAIPGASVPGRLLEGRERRRGCRGRTPAPRRRSQGRASSGGAPARATAAAIPRIGSRGSIGASEPPHAGIPSRSMVPTRTRSPPDSGRSGRSPRASLARKPVWMSAVRPAARIAGRVSAPVTWQWIRRWRASGRGPSACAAATASMTWWAARSPIAWIPSCDPAAWTRRQITRSSSGRCTRTPSVPGVGVGGPQRRGAAAERAVGEHLHVPMRSRSSPQPVPMPSR